MRLPKGTLMILLTAYWVGYWFYVGSLSDETLRTYIFPGLFAVWALSMLREILYFIGAIVDKTNRTRRVRAQDTKAMPKVSIIVPAFNEEESIAPSLKSVYEIDYQNFEVIFVDDGSVDHTLAIVT
ncbi:MAG: glycosyltransferase family 2 protein, partial [Bdellovibrionota bacterium]